MDHPSLSLHVAQILSALSDISDHIPTLPNPYRDTISSLLSELNQRCAALAADFDLPLPEEADAAGDRLRIVNEESLRAAIETAPIHVFTLDKDLRYVWSGGQRAANSPRPTLGRRAGELLPVQEAALLMEAEQQVLDSGQGLHKEVRFPKDGRLVTYDMAIEPLVDESNAVVGLTIAVMDVTEQRSLEAAQRKYAAQMEMQRRLTAQREQERAELARKLHDGSLQTLISLGFSLQIIKDILKKDRMDGDSQIQQMAVDIRNAVAELRHLCNELRPPVVSRQGLQHTLQEDLIDFQEKNPHLQVTAQFPDAPPALPELVEVALYRIYQHALSNILQHAAASQVWVRLQKNPQQVVFEVQDNGKGMAGPPGWNNPVGEGLPGMKERAEAVGGTLRLVSQPGKGTLVQVIVPLIDDFEV